MKLMAQKKNLKQKKNGQNKFDLLKGLVVD